jgi:hypothetical protein
VSGEQGRQAKGLCLFPVVYASVVNEIDSSAVHRPVHDSFGIAGGAVYAIPFAYVPPAHKRLTYFM